MADNGVDIAKAYVHLIPSMEGSQRTITDELVPPAERAGDTAGKKAGGRFKGAFTKLTAAAAIAGGAALAGFAVKGVKEFATFERGMNEVFTLLPGISEQAMGAMVDDTREFSREMGVAHSDAVPALYSALSAGVPKDNVFDFLETANQAALGGVTDLGTAVDGISSVTNAYGDQISGAAEASDLMFTAVKLGKTNFEELSGSLFNVIPTAASLGVGFGDVTAAMASMTAQGTPTSVATTQLRSMFVELSKDGSKLAGTFEEIAGKSFKDFIAEGGNTQEALALLAEHAEDTGVGVGDLFGSVEAGNAALALSGKNAEGYASNIDAMADSAGATEAAFDTMDQGLGRAWDSLKVNLDDAAISFGQQLAPAIEDVAAWAGDTLPGALDGLAGAFSTVLPMVTGLFDFLINNQWIFAVLAGLIGGALVASFVSWAASVVMANVAAAKWVATSIASATRAAAAWIVSVSQTIAIMALYAGQAVASATRAAAAWVVSSARTVASLVVAAAGFVAQGAVMAGAMAATVARVVAGWVLMGAQALAQGARMALAWVIAMGPVGLIIAAIAAVVAAIVWVATQTTFFQDVWAAVWGFIQSAIAVASVVIRSVLSAIASWWSSVWTGIQNVARTVWTFIKAFITAYINAVRAVIVSVVNGIRATWSAVWNGIKSVAVSVWSAITSAVSSAISRVRAVIASILGAIKAIWSAAWNGLKSTVSNIWNGIVGLFRGAVSTFAGIFSRIGDSIRSPFINAFNAVAGAWNSTVGAISFTIPDWVPGMGGKGFSVPNIPMLAEGGVATRPTLAMIGEGSESEAVLPLSKLQHMLDAAAAGPEGGGDTYQLAVTADMSRIRSVAELEEFIKNLTRIARQRAGTKGA